LSIEWRLGSAVESFLFCGLPLTDTDVTTVDSILVVLPSDSGKHRTSLRPRDLLFRLLNLGYKHSTATEFSVGRLVAATVLWVRLCGGPGTLDRGVASCITCWTTTGNLTDVLVSESVGELSPSTTVCGDSGCDCIGCLIFLPKS